eukprot:5002722-Pyramimonas_sp.AAC.1
MGTVFNTEEALFKQQLLKAGEQYGPFVQTMEVSILENDPALWIKQCNISEQQQRILDNLPGWRVADVPLNDETPVEEEGVTRDPGTLAGPAATQCSHSKHFCDGSVRVERSETKRSRGTWSFVCCGTLVRAKAFVLHGRGVLTQASVRGYYEEQDEPVFGEEDEEDEGEGGNGEGEEEPRKPADDAALEQGDTADTHTNANGSYPADIQHEQQAKQTEGGDQDVEEDEEAPSQPQWCDSDSLDLLASGRFRETQPFTQFDSAPRDKGDSQDESPPSSFRSCRGERVQDTPESVSHFRSPQFASPRSLNDAAMHDAPTAGSQPAAPLDAPDEAALAQHSSPRPNVARA